MYLFRKLPENILLDVTGAVFANGQLVSVTDSDGDTYPASQVQLLTPDNQILIPGFDYPLTVGDTLRLSHSDKRPWRLQKGWYSAEGTPAVWGWFLESIPAGECRAFREKDRMEVILIDKSSPYISTLEG